MLFALLLCASASFGFMRQTTTFSMKDPKGVTSILFTLDSAYEPLRGFATGIDRSVLFEPADVGATLGEDRADRLTSYDR